MTSKLPVVGKRYRVKGLSVPFRIRFIDLGIELDNGHQTSMSRQSLDDMNELEELPDSNPQEVEEDCPFETAAEEWNTTKVKKVSEKFYCKTCLNDTSEDIPCRQHSKDICCTCYNRKCDERIEDYNKVSEVERALEELEVELLLKTDCHFSRIERLEEKAQNLVNALEAEKARPKPEPAADENEQAYYAAISKYPKGIKAHSFYPYEPCECCSDPKAYAEFMSKPEPEIDMKEEPVEPVNTTITVGFEPNGRVMTPYEQIEEILEQIQKDIEELKRKASD